MKKPKIFVLTAVHNHIENTKSFLKSLDGQDYEEVSVIIIDDGSSDGTYEYIKNNYPKVKIIKGDGNLWWTGSLCTGIEEILKRSLKSDYILTINNDCTFNNDYLSSLINVAKIHPKFIVGSCVLSKKNQSVWDAGVYINWNPLNFYSDINVNKRDIENNVLYSSAFDTLSSKGTLFPVGLISKIGNFDSKSFPHYLSDYDYFYTAKKNGYLPVVSYKSLVFNTIERTGIGDTIKNNLTLKEYFDLLFSRKSKVNIVDHFKFVKKHSPAKYIVVNYLRVIAKAVHYLLGVYPFSLLPIFIKKIKTNSVFSNLN